MAGDDPLAVGWGLPWLLAPSMLAIAVGAAAGIGGWALWDAARGRLPLTRTVAFGFGSIGVFVAYLWLAVRLDHPWLVAVALVAFGGGMFYSICYDWLNEPPTRKHDE